MVSKSDPLLIVVSIVEGKRPRTDLCNCCFLNFNGVMWERGWVSPKNLVIFAFTVPKDLYVVRTVRQLI